MNPFKPNETMLNNYIQNKLSDTETEKMELWLADHPEALDDLELGVMFKQADSIKIKEVETEKNAIFSFLTSPKLIPVHLLSYALITFLIFNTLYQEEDLTLSPVTLYELEITRGNNDSPELITVSDSSNLVLRFFTGPNTQGQMFDMEIKPENIDESISFKNLVADQQGSIAVIITNVKNIEGKCDITIKNDTLTITKVIIITD